MRRAPTSRASTFTPAPQACFYRATVLPAAPPPAPPRTASARDQNALRHDASMLSAYFLHSLCPGLGRTAPRRPVSAASDGLDIFCACTTRHDTRDTTSRSASVRFAGGSEKSSSIDFSWIIIIAMLYSTTLSAGWMCSAWKREERKGSLRRIGIHQPTS
jgi:hypothetical protein